MFNSNIHLKSWTKTLRSGFELWPICVRVAFSSIINSALWWKTLGAWGLLLFKDLLNAQRYIQNQLSNFTLSAFQNSHDFYFCFRSFNQNNDGLSNRDSNEFISHSEKNTLIMLVYAPKSYWSPPVKQFIIDGLLHLMSKCSYN